MKKSYIYLLLLALVGSVSLSSCDSGTVTEDGYKLDLDLDKGQKFREHTFMETVLHESILTTNMNLEVGSDLEIIKSGDNGQIRMTYTKLHSGLKQDSTDEPSASDDMLHNVMNSMAIGKSVTLKLEDHKVSSISELEGPEGSKAIDTAFRAGLDTMAHHHVRNFSNFLLSIYPKKRVKPGESWTDSARIVMLGMNMNVLITYTLRSVTEGIADIDLKGKITGTSNMRLNNENIEMMVSGEQTGKLSMKTDGGKLIKVNYKIKAVAEADIMGTKLPMDLNAESTIEAVN